jgi:hypothetical protein
VPEPVGRSAAPLSSESGVTRRISMIQSIWIASRDREWTYARITGELRKLGICEVSKGGRGQYIPRNHDK